MPLFLELQFAVRNLIRTPGFTLIVVLDPPVALRAQ
jgi:hypothetical protein